MSKVLGSSSLMPEVSRSSVSHTETEAGPNYFAYHINEIEELFAQKDDLIASVCSKDPISFVGTCATVKDNGIDDNHCETKEGVTPSHSNTLFYNGVGDGLSVLKKERLKSSLKESANVFNQEVDETLHSVLGMYKVKKSLRDREHIANNSISADVDVSQSLAKKRKLSHSPSSTGVAKHAEGTSISEGMGTKDCDVVSSEESLSRDLGRICFDCKTTSTPQWREGPAGILCNACGIRNKKKGMSSLGLKKVEKKMKQELDEDLKFLLDIEGSHAKEVVEEVLKKYSDELDGKLGHMEHQVEKYLDVIVSKGRKMTQEEKVELRKLIQKLPPKNRDRVVDIIVQHRKLPEGHPSDEIRVDLEKEDNVTLWRLYYYAKAVANAKRCQDRKK